uniref:RNA helicase Mov10l1-like n=1 Tax=Styela clava TaxID=7725 RepID=UPI00193A7282|nr:RNA helicase Mov10l1-like [Styela clava]
MKPGMACLLAFLFGPEEASPFNKALHNYVTELEKQRYLTNDRGFEEFKRWLDRLNVSCADHFGSHHFISQCETRTNLAETIQKSVDGLITSISEDDGLIENHIYFKPSEVSAFEDDDIVKVGDRVQADAIRRITGNCGWTAIRVVKIGTSDLNHKDLWEDSVQLNGGLMVECITGIGENQGTLKHGVKFKLESVEAGYTPAVGDWVKLEASDNGEIAKVQPLRTKIVTGKVTRQPRYDKDNNKAYPGTVNNDIKFFFDVCDDGYKPWQDDEVAARAVESKQGQWNWRAISVKLIAKARSNTQTSGQFQSSHWTLRGGYPFAQGKRNTVPSFLPKYPVPENLKNRVENGSDVLCLLPSIKTGLCLENYAARFGALIYLEEIYADIEIRKHSLRDISLQRQGEYLNIYVAGIADGRPRLSIGDIVILHEPAAAKLSGLEYQGFIHHIHPEKEEILVKFHPTFQENFQVSDRYDVEFKYSRAHFRRCHFAVRLAQRRKPAALLFPDQIYKSPKQSVVDLFVKDNNLFFNTHLNTRQKQSVQRIIYGETRNHPYILFGPPGTGKTVTLVEVILQLYHLLKWCRILVCAPSNSAVDVICERLAVSRQVNESDMVRFNAFRRLESSIPESISKFCHKDEEIEKISHYRIILTTCVNAGIFYGLALPRDHFTHVCIDEAGQATEPEVLIPIGLQINGQVVMAGDPEQLGPVIMSPLANVYGLNISLLERLMKLDVYSRNDSLYKDGYNALFVTKLTNNYRSHPHLIELASKMFYMHELVPCADNLQYKNLLEWDKLPKKGFPILFHGIIGQQLRESNSPSLMNPTEIVQVIRYVKLLHRDEKVELSDIGVIAPYRTQVEKLRIMLRAICIDGGIKVGSVEEFQGQERSVIIISTVRSNSGAKPIPGDGLSVRGTLGFLSNSKRFNVATTRAKILMIILGNPYVLSIDSHWRALLKYCVSHGGYQGCDITSLKL